MYGSFSVYRIWWKRTWGLCSLIPISISRSSRHSTGSISSPILKTCLFMTLLLTSIQLYDQFPGYFQLSSANPCHQTHLHNRLTNDFGCMNYCLKAGEVPAADSSPVTVLAAVIVHDSVVAQGTASSSRYAKIKASEAALASLEGLPPFRFRELYLCDCQTVRKGDVAIDHTEVGTAV